MKPSAKFDVGAKPRVPGLAFGTLPSGSLRGGEGADDISGELETSRFQRTEFELKKNKLEASRGTCSKITPFLFVSDSEAAANRALLRRLGITQVINCAGLHLPNFFEKEHSEPSSTEASALSDQIKYVTLNMYDSPAGDEDLIWFVYDVIEAIHKERKRNCTSDGSGDQSGCGDDRGAGGGGRTLIHCVQGVSRSCSFAVAYVMWSQRLHYADALALVKAKRPVCSPNVAFTCNLVEWQKLRTYDTRTASSGRGVLSGSAVEASKDAQGVEGEQLTAPDVPEKEREDARGGGGGGGKSHPPMSSTRGMAPKSLKGGQEGLLWRLASHGPHDPKTVVPKLCSSSPPSSALSSSYGNWAAPHNRLLDSRGTFIAVVPASVNALPSTSSSRWRCFVWVGSRSPSHAIGMSGSRGDDVDNGIGGIDSLPTALRFCHQLCSLEKCDWARSLPLPSSLPQPKPSKSATPAAEAPAAVAAEAVMVVFEGKEPQEFLDIMHTAEDTSAAACTAKGVEQWLYGDLLFTLAPFDEDMVCGEPSSRWWRTQEEESFVSAAINRANSMKSMIKQPVGSVAEDNSFAEGDNSEDSSDGDGSLNCGSESDDSVDDKERGDETEKHAIVPKLSLGGVSVHSKLKLNLPSTQLGLSGGHGIGANSGVAGSVSNRTTPTFTDSVSLPPPPPPKAPVSNQVPQMRMKPPVAPAPINAPRLERSDSDSKEYQDRCKFYNADSKEPGGVGGDNREERDSSPIRLFVLASNEDDGEGDRVQHCLVWDELFEFEELDLTPESLLALVVLNGQPQAPLGIRSSDYPTPISIEAAAAAVNTTLMVYVWVGGCCPLVPTKGLLLTSSSSSPLPHSLSTLIGGSQGWVKELLLKTSMDSGDSHAGAAELPPPPPVPSPREIGETIEQLDAALAPSAMWQVEIDGAESKEFWAAFNRGAYGTEEDGDGEDTE